MSTLPSSSASLRKEHSTLVLFLSKRSLYNFSIMLINASNEMVWCFIAGVNAPFLSDGLIPMYNFFLLFEMNISKASALQLFFSEMQGLWALSLSCGFCPVPPRS